jgi:hypothetical protein
MKPTKLFKKTPKKRRRPPIKKTAAANAEYQRARERLLFGTLGAASPVRRIDPITGEVIAVIDSGTGAALPMDASAKARRA